MEEGRLRNASTAHGSFQLPVGPGLYAGVNRRSLPWLSMHQLHQAQTLVWKGYRNTAESEPSA